MTNPFAGMMQQIETMKQKTEEMQTELEAIEVLGESGAGLVKVTMNGKGEVRNIEVDPSVYSEDKQVLLDLIAASFNDGRIKRQRAKNEKFKEVLAAAGLPTNIPMPFMDNE